MTKEQLKSEFMKIYYSEQAGDNEILEDYEHAILNTLIEEVYNSDNFKTGKITDIEEMLPIIGRSFEEACKAHNASRK